MIPTATAVVVVPGISWVNAPREKASHKLRRSTMIAPEAVVAVVAVVVAAVAVVAAAVAATAAVLVQKGLRKQ